LFQEATVRIETGPLAKNGPIELPIKRLVTNCLCEGHNGVLSELDQAGIDFQNALRRAWELHNVRSPLAGHRKWKPVRLTVDGPRLERWLLKFAFSAAPVFRQQLNDWKPPAESAALALGTRAFGEGLGLYAAGQPGDELTNEEQISFTYGTRLGSDHPVAFTVALRGGYRLIATWNLLQHPEDSLVFGTGAARPLSTLIRHPNRFEFKAGSRDLGLSVDFDWSGKWSAAMYPQVAALRARYPAPPR
jgi:hypothetical protein